MRILVAVLSSRGRHYSTLTTAAKRTWASADVENVDTVFYYGGEVFREVGNDVYLPVDDDLWHMGEKTRAFFQWALNSREFDLLYRTNASSYVDLPNLRTYAERHAHMNEFYSGVIGTHAGVTFASGSGFFLSRDLVGLAAAAEWNHRFKDDWSLGGVLNQHHLYPVPAPRCEMESHDDLARFDPTAFHFRCKTQTTLRQGDVQLMLAIHRRFCETRGIPVPRSLPARYALSKAIEMTAPAAMLVRRSARQANQRLRTRFGTRVEAS